MWDGDLFPALQMTPDLMATRTGAIELKAKGTKPAHDFTVGKSSQTAH
jgi:hypothetical protein